RPAARASGWRSSAMSLRRTAATCECRASWAQAPPSPCCCRCSNRPARDWPTADCSPCRQRPFTSGSRCSAMLRVNDLGTRREARPVAGRGCIMTVADPSTLDGGLQTPRTVTLNRTGGDRVFRALCFTAGMITLVLLGLIGLFLLIRAKPALQAGGWSFFTTEVLPANPVAGKPFGIAALIFGTVEISLIAMLFATPVAIATALFISEYAPRRLRR